MKILSVESGPVATNAYLIIDEPTGSVVGIDAPMGSASWYTSTLAQQGVVLTQLWLTHSHWDHTADAAALKNLTGARILIHPDDEYRLIDPNAHTVFQMPFNFEAAKADRYVNHLDILQLGTLSFEVRHTPGHTEGGVCFINHQERVAFVGDSLFDGSVGRTDLPGGDFQTLIASIYRELLVLDDDYEVYPGHMNKTTIGEQRLHNPFLQGDGVILTP